MAKTGTSFPSKQPFAEEATRDALSADPFGRAYWGKKGPRRAKGTRLKIASPRAVDRRKARQKAQKLARKAQRSARA